MSFPPKPVLLGMKLRRNKSVTLVLGGARSGKSRYAQKLASELKRVAFIATARPTDPEMRRKIARHRSERPASWETLEAPTDLASAIESQGRKADVILVDCLTFYLANVMGSTRGVRAKIEKRLEQVCHAIQTSRSSVIVVSNEVGCGVVPPFRSGRRYRDLLGQLNQQMAEIADRVIFMVAGIPLAVKDALDSAGTRRPQTGRRPLTPQEALGTIVSAEGLTDEATRSQI